MNIQINEAPIIPREVIFGQPFNFDPKISPDGEKVAYLSYVNKAINLRVKKLYNDDDRPLTFFEKDIQGYFWSSDKYIIYFQDMSDNSGHFFYRLDVETGEIKELIPNNDIKIDVVKHNIRDFPDEFIVTVNRTNTLFPDLYHLNVISGCLKLIERNHGNIITWLVNSQLNLSGIVVVNCNDICELMIKNKENIWTKLLEWSIEEQPETQPIGFSKDSSCFYFIDKRNYNTSHVVKMYIETGQTEILACHEEYDIYETFIREREGFVYKTHNILFKPDTDEIQAISFYKSRREWIILDEALKEDIDVIKNINKGDFVVASRDIYDNIWIVSFENDDCPVSYYIYNRKTKEWKFLFYTHPDLISYTMSSMEEISFTSRDGLTLNGYITYPPGNVRKNLPMVLYVHKGPWFRDVWGYDPVVQWFANRGYLCLQINYRGSIGYGKNFLNAGDKEWGGRMQDDIIDGVNWAIEKGIAHPGKIAIYGSGYGGYASLLGATANTDMFSCAIAVGCPGNLITFIEAFLKVVPSYLQVKPNKFIKRIGDLHKDRDLLISRSPFYKLEHIKIPLLIAHGLKNQIIKSEETYEVVKYLRSKGIYVEYLVFPDEGYYITKPKNRIKFYGMIEKFLAKYLGGRYEACNLVMDDMDLSISKKKTFNDHYFINRILREGDMSSFEELMKYYEKPLLKYLSNITGDYVLSLELLHETFSRIWFYLDSYSFDMPFHSWMFKIANNVVKKYRIRKMHMSSEIKFDEVDPILITDNERFYDKILVRSIVDSLNGPYKTSLILRFIEELDYKEIASIMNISESQVKNYLFRARKSLWKIWMEKGAL